MKKPSLALLLALAVVMLSLGALAREPRETVHPTLSNGHPALLFTGESNRLNIVELTGSGPNTALVFHLMHVRFHSCPGLLTITSQSIRWEAFCDKDVFDSPHFGVEASTYARGAGISLKAAGKHYSFIGSSENNKPSISKLFCRFLLEAIDNFPAATQEFWHLHGGEPSAPAAQILTPQAVQPAPAVQPPAPAVTAADNTQPPAAAPASEEAAPATSVDDEEDFHTQASAWRALTVKPELPAETRKNRSLAEAYLREKDVKGAIEHYEAGVKACPVWPEGWFNLALLYAEQGNYAMATSRMKHYLELMPDAPDAPAARYKMLIWEDKAARQ